MRSGERVLLLSPRSRSPVHGARARLRIRRIRRGSGLGACPDGGALRVQGRGQVGRRSAGPEGGTATQPYYPVDQGG
eukprot:5968216-Alexandrium_andersonii.AAC.1